MLAFTAVQSKIVELISAHAAFAGLTVLADSGSQANEKTLETALESMGAAVSAWPPYNAVLVQGAVGKVLLDVEAGIFIEINPERNDPVKRLNGVTSLGNWNANTNVPDISAIEEPVEGDYFTVSVAGETELDGCSTWAVGDVVAFDGDDWVRATAAKEMFGLIKSAIEAVLAFRGINPNDLFTLAREPITLDTFDAGLFRYHIVFAKRCVL